MATQKQLDKMLKQQRRGEIKKILGDEKKGGKKDVRKQTAPKISALQNIELERN